MGTEYTVIEDRIQKWMERQKMYFVATAPLAGDGLVNCSPKGLDSLRVLSPTEIAYVDVGGSGIETVAHVKENRRIVIMMCAFDGPPKIFRFYGRGAIVEPEAEEFREILAQFPLQPAARCIVRVHVDRIIDSCGYGVPLYEFKSHRESLPNYFEKLTSQEIETYRQQNNLASLDGLAGLTPAKSTRAC